MKDKSIDIQIEIAKSWIQLAQIMIILAGFLFTTSGVIFNEFNDTSHLIDNKVSLLSEEINKINSINESNIPQLNKSYLSIQSDTKILIKLSWLWLVYLVFGFVISFVSWRCWNRGNKQLKKIKNDVEKD